MQQLKQIRMDRYASIVVYPDGCRDVTATAKDIYKKLYHTEAPHVLDISFNKPLNIWVAIMPYKKVDKKST
jgi:hypothetical protein